VKNKIMDEKALFSAAVRVLGLLAAARGVADLVYVAMYALGTGDFSVNARFPGADLIFGIVYLAFGLYGVRGAGVVIDYAFPTKLIRTEPDTADKVSDS
jgi:hypothetical protein